MISKPELHLFSKNSFAVSSSSILVNLKADVWSSLLQKNVANLDNEELHANSSIVISFDFLEWGKSSTS